MVSSRRPPKPPQLDQKISESRQPTAPTTSRITPIRCRFTADVDVLTAQARIAPAAIKIKLTPIPIFKSPFAVALAPDKRKTPAKRYADLRSLLSSLAAGR